MKIKAMSQYDEGSKSVWDLGRGEEVVAVRDLDFCPVSEAPQNEELRQADARVARSHGTTEPAAYVGAQVRAGTVGVVFEEGDGSYGPLVRWENGGVCNVYPGDVGLLPKHDGLRPTLSEALEAMKSDYPDLMSSRCGCCEEKRQFYKRLKPWQLPDTEQ